MKVKFSSLANPLLHVVITVDARPSYWAFYFQGSRLLLTFIGTWLDSFCRIHTALKEFQVVVVMLHKMAFHLCGEVVPYIWIIMLIKCIYDINVV